MKTFFVSILFLFVTVTTVNAQQEATFYTNFGDFDIELYTDIMPITTQNFIDLTDSLYYDSIIFHRVISNFVIQGGDPTGTGFGGPGYTISDEFDSTTSNTHYTMAMANTGAPNSGGSQFFFNLKDNTGLDFDKAPFTSKHPVFGEVISGFSVVDAIGVTPVDGNDRPINPVMIDSIRINRPKNNTSIQSVSSGKLVLDVYPNPTTGNATLKLYSESDLGSNLIIMDLQGKEVYSRFISLIQGENIIALDQLDMLGRGTYLISINRPDKTPSTSLINLN